MSEHTKEPWEVKEVQGQVFVAAKPYKGHPYFERTTTDASARRIVACLNVCRDIPTERLEEAVRLGITDIAGGNLFSARLKLQKQRDKAEQQRDKLMAICNSVVENGIGASDIRAMKEIIAEVEASK